MDEARCLNPISIVTSEELYLIESPSLLHFVCDECEVELIPCSYVKDVNLRKPYFRTKSPENHKQGCSAEGDSKIRSKGASSRLTNAEGFPLAYPNKFKLRKDDLTDDSNIEAKETKAIKTSSKSTGNSPPKDRKKISYETTSFRSIVNQYFDFPFDRDRPLSFEGVKGSTYSDVFSRINSTIGKQQYRIQGTDRKIYYGVLS